MKKNPLKFRRIFEVHPSSLMLAGLLVLFNVLLPSVCSSHDNKNVHPYLAEEAYRLLSEGAMKAEFGQYLGNYRGEKGECAAAKSGSTITDGASDEDVYDPNADLCLEFKLLDPGGAVFGFNHHFNDPDVSIWSNGLCDDMGAYGQAIWYWLKIKENYADLNTRPLAYWYVGRVAHLIGDMSVPAHVLRDPHPSESGLGDPDPYEAYVAGRYGGWTSEDARALNATSPVPPPGP